jgi:uncharacterized protein YacL
MATGLKTWILPLGFAIAVAAASIRLKPFGPDPFLSILGPSILVCFTLLCEHRLKRANIKRLVGGGAGLLFGLGVGMLLSAVFSPMLPRAEGVYSQFFIPFATGFLGLSLALEHAGSLFLPPPSSDDSETQMAPNPVRYLDTSALIDGRVVDLVDSDLLPGLFIIPQFVLNELQTIADTADALRRNRGRRGLELAARLQKCPGIRVEISRVDLPGIPEVDRKLIEVARNRRAQIVTTDYNLSKLAQAQGISVLNLNELATALRPVVLQGETVRVSITKPGKEHQQGLAYLEDGTTVVVDNAVRQIGKTVDVVVTGVVQSATGRMIFARY